MNEEEIRREIDRLKDLREQYNKRLFALEKRLALLGYGADVSIEIEINEIKLLVLSIDQDVQSRKEVLLGSKYQLLKQIEEVIKVLEDNASPIGVAIDFLELVILDYRNRKAKGYTLNLLIDLRRVAESLKEEIEFLEAL